MGKPGSTRCRKFSELLLKGSQNDPEYSLLRNGNGKLVFSAYKQNSTIQLLSSSKIKSDKWTHLAVTALDGNFSLYINGELEGFSSNPDFVPLDGTGDLIIGGYSINSSDPFIGQIDEIRIHDRAFFEKGRINALQAGIISPEWLSYHRSSFIGIK